MKFIKDPMHQALIIAWSIFLGLCGIAGYALAGDWWIPMIWPFLFVAYVTHIILKMKRERDDYSSSEPANISGKPTSVRRSDR